MDTRGAECLAAHSHGTKREGKREGGRVGGPGGYGAGCPRGIAEAAGREAGRVCVCARVCVWGRGGGGGVAGLGRARQGRAGLHGAAQEPGGTAGRR